MAIKCWLKTAFATYCIVAAASAQHSGTCRNDEFPCGASCIGAGQKCDGQFDCPDGRDEALSLCKDSERPIWPILFHCSVAWVPEQAPSVCPAVCAHRPGLCAYALLAEHGAPGSCKLPPYPEHGSYSVFERPRTDTFTLHFSCDGAYNLDGASHVRCQDGKWQDGYPTCKPIPATYAVRELDIRK